MEDQILHFIALLGQWAYVLFFLAAFLESAALLGLLFPGETIVVVAGILASQNYLVLGACLIVVSLGALLGDTTGFFLGRKIGKNYFEHHRRLLLIKRKHLDRVNAYFEQHGGKTVFFGRFIGFLRALAPFAAGTAGMPYARFIRYNAPGGLLWSCCFILLGYFFGHSWHAIERSAGKIGLFIFLIVLSAVGFASLYRRAVRNREQLLAWWSEIARVPTSAVTRFLHRHERLQRFLMDRFSPAGYLGLHLTVGLLLCAFFGWTFGFIGNSIMSGRPLFFIDARVSLWLLGLAAPDVTTSMRVIAEAGSPGIAGIGTIFLLFVLLIRRKFAAAVTLVAAVVGSIGLLVLVKAGVPHLSGGAEASGLLFGFWTFPSATLMVSTVFYGMAAYFAINGLASWKGRVLVVVSTGFILFLISASVIYLQIEFFSDVIGGIAGGLFWLTVCITGHEVYQKSKSA